jgi:hypothetical protein
MRNLAYGITFVFSTIALVVTAIAAIVICWSEIESIFQSAGSALVSSLHHPWRTLMMGFSLGGSFFGAAAIAFVSTGVALWAFCVFGMLPINTQKMAKNRILVVLWVATSCSVLTTFAINALFAFPGSVSTLPSPIGWQYFSVVATYFCCALSVFVAIDSIFI